GDQVDNDDLLDEGHHVAQGPSGGRAHRHLVLVVALSRAGEGRQRHAAAERLGRQRGTGELHAFETVVQTLLGVPGRQTGDEVRRETAVELLVDDQLEL